MTSGSARYGISVTGAHKGEYTLCRAKDMASCPYHSEGSHKTMSSEQAQHENERIIAYKMQRGSQSSTLSKSRDANIAVDNDDSVSTVPYADRKAVSPIMKSSIKKSLAIAMAGTSLFTLAACGGNDEYVSAPVEEPSESVTKEAPSNDYQKYLNKLQDKMESAKGTDAYKQAKDAYDEFLNSGEIDISKLGLDGSSANNNTNASDVELLSSWDDSKAPNYYAVTGGAVLPSDDELVPSGTIEYGGVDSLGRTGYAHGNITGKMIADSAGERQEFDNTADDISGWVNTETGKSNNGKTSIIMTSGNLDKSGKPRVYNGYFYNRSHLIADSLGGDATRVNLITGTRTQNVGDNSGSPGGMAYAEKQIREYLKEHEDVTCAYYAQPVYNGDEIIPRGVTIDVRTSDDAVDEHVVVWNYANGHTINYNTGAWE